MPAEEKTRSVSLRGLRLVGRRALPLTVALLGALVAPTLHAALEAGRGDALRRGVSDIMVIGGAEIYAQAMRFATRLEITQIHAAPPGDTRFPEIDPAIWREAARTAHPAGPNDDAAYDLVTYRRTADAVPHR